jgi:hypothetical protein
MSMRQFGGGGVSAIKKGEFQLLEIGLKILTKKNVGKAESGESE